MVRPKEAASGVGWNNGIIVGTALGLLILAGTIGLGIVHAALRGSVNYFVSLDSISSAGGAANSLTFRESDSAVGQESVTGPAIGVTTDLQCGVVQNWEAPRNASTEWRAYR